MEHISVGSVGASGMTLYKQNKKHLRRAGYTYM